MERAPRGHAAALRRNACDGFSCLYKALRGRAELRGTGTTVPVPYQVYKLVVPLGLHAVATHVPRATCRGAPPNDRRRGRASWRDARPAPAAPTRLCTVTKEPSHARPARGIRAAGARRRPAGPAPSEFDAARSRVVRHQCGPYAIHRRDPSTTKTKRNTITPRPTKTPSASCPSSRRASSCRTRARRPRGCSRRRGRCADE